MDTVSESGNPKGRPNDPVDFKRRPSGDSAPPAVWFAYSPARKGIHPQTHLAKFEGVLQADAYASFNALYERGGIDDVACWPHARRKFHDLHAARRSPLTTEALRRIVELYLIEAEIRGRPSDERRSVRQARARPLLDDLEQWLRASLEKRSRRSDTSAAILYAPNLCQQSCATATTASSRSTTLPPSVLRVALPSVAATTCSLTPTAAANFQRPSTR